MTNEERDIISRFVARVGGSPQQGFGTPPTGSQVPALPAVDQEADRFISDQFSQHPEARYRITQMAFVQEAALAEAQNRIRRLEWEVQQARSQPQAQAQPQGAAPSRGFFGNLFGGGQPQAGQAAGGFGGQPQGYGRPPGYGQQYQAPPQPQYPPGYQPGMLQQQAGGGSGFLGSALTTAAGVAGGMVAGNALMGLFSGHEGGGFGGGGGHETVNETINNYGTDPAAAAAGGADPWAGAGTADTGGGFPQDQGPVDQGSGFDQGGVDPGGFDQGGFDQGGSDQGGGWDDSGGGGGGSDPFG